jgi:hypothetical protein
VTVVEVEGDVAVLDDTAEAFGLGLVTGLTVEPASLPAALFQGLTAVDVAGAVVATPVGLGLTGGDTVFCLGLVTVGDAALGLVTEGDTVFCLGLVTVGVAALGLVGLGLTGGDTVFCLGLVTVGDATPELRWGVLLPRPPPLNTTVLGSPEYPPCCLLSP